MTDITELAQSLKAAAEKATPGEWHKGRQDPVTGIIKVYARTGSTKLNCVVKTDAHEVGFGISEREHKANAELISLANPANILALVEALEKAQQTEKTLESRNRRLDGIITAAEKRIAELESKITNPVQLPKTNGYWTETEKAYEDAITLAKRQIRLAGFSVEDM
ncbi:TPA: ead/Ea22-like family protein [Salmonella enterica subsp. enterica serovar Concord]|nr:ead/Ea22-like family protein [Salmonella enterica subsp. enterica serovar Concord]